MTDQDDKRRRRYLRVRGYADGLANRPATTKEAEYQRSWRRGQEARNASTTKEDPHG